MNLEIDINEDQAWALAQFVKRVGFVEFKDNSENEAEAYMMRDAVIKLQDA